MSGPRILGLDLSFTKVGIAYPDGTTERLTGPTSAGGRTTYERLWRFATIVTRRIKDAEPTLVVLEDYALHSPGILSTIRAAEVGGIVRATLWRLAIPFEPIKPNELKAFATGNGNANKDRMVEAAIARGARADVDDDQADAYLLRAMALEAYLSVDPIIRARFALGGRA